MRVSFARRRQTMQTKQHLWNPEREAMPKEELHSFQGQRLREQVKHVYENSAFFRELYDQAGVHPKEITDREDLSKLPTFNKDNLRAHRERTGDHWCGVLCVPVAELVFATHSTGTSGKPNYYGVTRRDVKKITEQFARMCYSWGLRKGDRINMPGSMHWHGYVQALEWGIQEVGATPIRRVGGTQDICQQLFEGMPLANLDAVFVYQPEREMKYIQENNIKPRDVFPHVRFACSTVDASKPRRQLWQDQWGAFKNAYGSGDQFWTFYQCEADDTYFHVPEDHIIAEVLNPKTGEQVAPGEYGELFITNLRDEANPYIRYGMEDIVDFKTEKCACARTTMRIRPLGRLAWSVNIKGKSRPVTSVEVEEVIWGHEELFGENYQLVKTDPNEQSELIVRVATDKDLSSGVIRQVESALESAFNTPATLQLVSSDKIGLEGASAIKMERVSKEY